MESPAMAGKIILMRDLNTPVGSTNLSLGAIIGIAIGGALLLFLILVAVGITHVNRKHRKEKRRLLEANESGSATVELKSQVRSARTSQFNLNQRLPLNSLLHSQEDVARKEWSRQDGLQKPPIAKSRAPRRSLFRTPSVRDSWPLNTNLPSGFNPGQTSMVLSPVAPPGYVVQDQRWPGRTTSLPGKKYSLDRSKSASSTRGPSSVDAMYYKKVHRRSTSETQLSTILRSTSQRLKSAQRPSMTRTASSLGQFPGLPPSERLPTPPRKVNESREGLIDHDPAESVGSSIYDVYARTPSPVKKHQRTSSKRSVVRFKSPAASVESKDSLCASDTPDMVVPAPLTSPSKSPRTMQRQSGNQAKDTSVVIHQDSPAPLFAKGPQDALSSKIFLPPKRTSLTGDPFYAPVRSSKLVMSTSQIQGPRPMYLRKATFGQDCTTERPASSCSPLRDVSGNSQSSSKRILPDLPATGSNLFQWDPQDAMQAGAKGNNPRRKGHKRSNVIRMSISRPLSTVDIVPEEPETIAPLKFNIPEGSSFLSIESTQPVSPTKPSKASPRPPSIATFNPTLKPDLARSENDSPILGERSGYSPTLSVCNYYAENDPGSEDEFFKSKTKSSNTRPRSGSVIKSRGHSRNNSTDTTLLPHNEPHQYPGEGLLSFPALPADNIVLKISPASTPPPALRPLPNLTATTNGLSSTVATPASPVLTIPGSLIHDTSEPDKRASATLSPPHGDSIITSISFLRRMNSEISTNRSTPLGSPTLPSDSPLNNSPLKRDTSNISFEERGRSRGSQHYLSLGQSMSRQRTRERPASARHPHPEKRDSHRVHKERRRRQTELFEASNPIEDLSPVKEGSASTGAGGKNVLNNSIGPDTDRDMSLKFPTLSREGSILYTPPRMLNARLSAVILEPVVDEKPPVDRTDFWPTPTPSPSPTLPAATTGLLGGIGLSKNGIRLPHPSAVEPDVESRPQLQHAHTDTEAKPKTQEHGKADQPNPPRWSDAMVKPPTHVTRRESKMEHPIPSPGNTTPPHWTTGVRLSGLGLAGVRLMESEEGRIVWGVNSNPKNESKRGSESGGYFGVIGDARKKRRSGEGNAADTPKQNMDFYDQDGFLKGSPEREKERARFLAAHARKEGQGQGNVDGMR